MPAAPWKVPVASKSHRCLRTSPPLASLTAPDLTLPTAANQWIKDANASALNPKYTGTYLNALNYGWLSYFPTAAASACEWPARRGAPDRRQSAGAPSCCAAAKGSTYARFHLTKIQYADPNVNSSAQTWTINFDVQP